MWKFVCLGALLLSSATASADIMVSSRLGRMIMEQAIPEHGRELEEQDSYFLTQYAIKFQGCHHVQQWNDNANNQNNGNNHNNNGNNNNNQNNVRIMTKRLARFRLCPADQCSNERSVGCTSKYGDYIVDLDTFVDSYLQALENDQEGFCTMVEEDCLKFCGGDEDESCTNTCYQSYNALFCINGNYGNNNNNNNKNKNNFNVREYAQCKKLEMHNRDRRELEEQQQQVEYYVGAFCADQGGEVRLGVFTDNTCTTFASSGSSVFSNYAGYQLPYSSNSLISSRCMDCMDSNDNGNYNLKQVCSQVYQMSGKCETRMSIDYPNESSCNYIEGVKIIRQDGVIRTSSVRKSKSAAVAIGLFSTLSVLLAGYVFYLRTKLARAQINLAAAGQYLG